MSENHCTRHEPLKVGQVWAVEFAGRGEELLRITRIEDNVVRFEGVSCGSHFGYIDNGKPYDGKKIADPGEHVKRIKDLLPSHSTVSPEEAIRALEILEPTFSYRSYKNWIIASRKFAARIVRYEGGVKFTNSKGETLRVVQSDLDAVEVRRLVKHLECGLPSTP